MRVKTLVAAALALAGTATLAQPAAHAAGPPTPAPGTHLMIDAASAPSLSTVKTWQQKSPYDAIGVYIPVSSAVDDRYDKFQANLTADWVSAVRAGGWQVLPIYVGRQAPDKCTTRSFHYISNNATTAAQQGRDAASDAAASAKRLGLSAAAPIVYDMEAYDSGCSTAMRAFYAGWTAELHTLGRMSGIYGSRNSTITDVAALPAHGQASPDVVWVATASGQAQTATLPPLPDGSWNGKRLNQFNLGVTRSYGGVSINVDESAVDDYVWDTTAPTVTMPTIAPATGKAKVSVDWTGADTGGSGVAHYQVRTRDVGFGKALGAWSKAKTVKGSVRRAKLSAGEQYCIKVRATDRAGNTSAWSRSVCTTRYVDDRRLSPSKGWHKAHNAAAYARTTTVARHKGRTLSTGKVHARSIGVVLRGTGTVNVLIGHHKVGTVSGSGLVWLHLSRTHHGVVRLKTVSKQKVAIDGLALAQV
ncbi:DUF1906 domain-containing protein [Nocardioides sp. BP30]|uniref:glycoside hydrolase domain-containing protein n=1 Tax=Nocardioides sp. BP30 TaxID=3036374 RepID=UPI0024686802|nr:glycoside hydrolase domain-containing protein [Nocardioides sp. BP30]WGL53064.1 DUF1906 domain-containing protein [Nocardioides sp. BP30]